MSEWPIRPVPPSRQPPVRSGVTTRTVLLAAVVVVTALAAVATVLIVTSSNADAAIVTMEPVDAPGANPFLPSVAKQQTPLTPPTGTGGPFPATTRGLYGGTLNNASCDGPAMVAFLQADPAKAAAWADVLGIAPADIAGYVAGLTPVVLRSDTYVTNHGYADGHATTLISVLQAGTAVFVDQFGLPRVRCFCGNPLTAVTPPETPGFVGAAWPGFSRTSITVVQQTTVIIDQFTLVDVTTGDVFTRNRGPAVDGDRPESGAAGASTVPVPPTGPVPPTVVPTVRPPGGPQTRTVEGSHVLSQADGAECSFSDAPRISGSFTLTVQADGSASGRLSAQGSGTRDLTCGDAGARMAWSQRYSATFTGRVTGGKLTGSGTLHNVNSTRMSGCTNAGHPVACEPYQTGPGDYPITLSGSYDSATGRGQGSFTVGKVARTTVGSWTTQ
jgi:hypothetical protein